MSKEEGIPKEVIEELKLKEPEKEPIRVTLIKEGHQVRIPIPSKIRQEIDFNKYKFGLVEYDEKSKIIICILKND